jgi:hypothetical protein
VLYVQAVQDFTTSPHSHPPHSLESQNDGLGTDSSRHTQGPRHRGNDLQDVCSLFLYTISFSRLDRCRRDRELKRREKQREKDAKKAEKAANAPPTHASSAPKAAAANEDDLNPNVSRIQYIAIVRCGIASERQWAHLYTPYYVPFFQ